MTSPPPIVHDAQYPPDSSTTKGQTATANGGRLEGKTFVQKIHSLLARPKYSSIISWNDAGTSVTIHDADEFTSIVIPAHFKRSKFGSFIRKLRRWGFSVITKKRPPTSTLTVVEFSSEHFIRDQPNLCLLMKDERHVKKQFSFMDNVRMPDRGKSKPASLGRCVHFPHSPSYATNMHTMNNQADYQSRHYNSMPSMAMPNQYSYCSTMPMNNMMQPSPPVENNQYHPFGNSSTMTPPYGQNNFGSSPHGHQHQYQAPDMFSPDYSQQQQHMMMQHGQRQQSHPMSMIQHNQMQMPQENEMQMNQNQYFSPPPPYYMNRHNGSGSGSGGGLNNAASSSNRHGNNNSVNLAASTSNGVVSSSSGESNETLNRTKMNLWPSNAFPAGNGTNIE